MYAHTEEVIERFIRYPNTLTPDERAAVERLLEVNATARRLAEFYRTFYAELDKELDTHSVQATDAGEAPPASKPSPDE